jgi:arginyl-tRNA synthetase
MLIKTSIAELIRNAVLKAQAEGRIGSAPLPEIIIERPQNVKHGDYASSIALKMARAIKMNPMQIASEIAAFIPEDNEFKAVTVSAPGFINFKLKEEWLAKQVKEILGAKDKWGNLDTGKGQSMQVEFVSVNPTGPLHVGHGRGAVLGSALANILRATGYKVQTEYYINDAGNQLETFKKSLFARYKQLEGVDIPVPEGGYVGEYMIAAAEEIKKSSAKELAGLHDEELMQVLGKIGLDLMLKNIREELEVLGITFDNWFSEKSLKLTGTYDKVMKFLKDNNHVVDREKALWFASTALGEDKDNVLIRSDGTPTYFAFDIAYHYDKFVERKFQRVVDIWGADHQGHVSRMKAAIGAFGVNPDDLTIIICQIVTLKRGEEVVRASKRAGNIITLKEVMDEVGPDACRFVFLSRSADSQMDFDLELAKKQSSDNPVYYVQYAHARICSILKLAQEKGISFEDGDISVLTTEAELALIRQMIKLPEVLDLASTNLEPHHLPFYSLDLATSFHGFYKDCRVISEDMCMSKARLKLVKAAQIVLARTLDLMGMTAPESM